MSIGQIKPLLARRASKLANPEQELFPAAGGAAQGDVELAQKWDEHGVEGEAEGAAG